MSNIKNTAGNICIIGAGIGGLTTGALLTRQGYNVEIFEKEPIVGGRALSLNGNSLTFETYNNILSQFHMNIPFSEPTMETIFDKKMLAGYTLDLGFHTIGGGVGSNLNRVLSEFGEQVEMFESKVGLIKNSDFDFPFLSTGDKIKILPRLLQLLFSGESTMRKLDDIPMTETINKYGKSKMKLILEIFSRAITTVNNLDRISTGDAFRAQKNLLKGSKPVGYPRHGLQRVSQTIAHIVKRNGGEIHLNHPVEKIVIDDNKVVGVVVGDEEHFFKRVITNIPVQNLFFIADEKHFPTEYVRTLKTLTGTGSLCAYYSLNKIDPQLPGKSFLFIERNAGLAGNDAVGMIDFMAALPESGLAPTSHQLVQAYIICSPEEAQSGKKLDELKNMLDTNLENLMPAFRSQLQWSIYPAVWHLDGVAKTIDNKKPGIQTPIENLYLVGDCVKSPDIGINCAINSAKTLQAILARED